MTTAQRVARIGLALALLAALALVLSPLGYRAGFWGLRVSFYYLIGGAMVLGALALVVSIVGSLLLRRSPWRARLPALVGVVLALVAGGYPAAQVVKARSVPPIHDITTDTADPPTFVALEAARRAAPNGAVYGGAAVAEQQKRGYPDIATLHSSLAPAALLALATRTAANLGWSVVESASHDGRIEATDTTPLFGFKDDIVIRIRAAGRGSDLDMRSVSRLGASDLGANAARVRKFLDKLRESGA